MSCKKCNTPSGKCGCKDTAYTTIIPPTCEPPCVPQCSEVISARCVVMPDGISEIGSEPNDTIEEIVQRIILFLTNPDCLNTDAECNCGGEPILLQTNDIDNLDQTVLNNTESFGMKLTDNGSGEVLYEAVVNENKAVYVDLTYGDDATAEKYNSVRPYATFTAAYSAAVAGDVIVFNGGTYTLGTVSVTKTDVHFYAKPGVIFNNTGFSVTTGLNWRFYGFAVFTGGGTEALSINSVGAVQDIYFEFDKIDGSKNRGIYIKDQFSSNLKVTINGNEIKSTATTADWTNCPVRVDNVTEANIQINIKHRISCTQRTAIRLGNEPLGGVPMTGTVVINCPIIENTGSVSNRGCIYLAGALSTYDSSGYKIIVNSDIIRQTNPVMTETGSNIISSCVIIDGGNNVYINGDLEGNACLAVCNRGIGATPHYGTIVFEGNMSSNIECISSCVKLSNGNGWHSIVAKNGVIKSKGSGDSIAVVDRPDAWNLTNAGTAGQMYFINCRIINDNINGSLSAVGVNMSPVVALDSETLFLYDTPIFAKAATVCITSSNVSEPVGMINSRSNVALDVMIVDSYTGFTLTSILQLPKY